MIQNPVTYLWKELQITFASAMVMVALFIISLRFATPYIPQALPGLKYWVEYQVQNPVSIKDLKVIWLGAKPAIRLVDVTLLDEQRENPIVTANNIDIILSPLDSIINGKFKVAAVVIDGARLRFSPDVSGAQANVDDMDVMGWIESDTPFFQTNAAWIEVVRGLPVHKVVVKNTDIHILEPNGQSWPLVDVTAAIIRNDQEIHLRSTAKLLSDKVATFSIGADISQAFSAPTGTLVMQAEDFPLSRISDWFPDEISKTATGNLDLNLWTSVSKGQWSDVKIQFSGENIALTKPETDEIGERFQRIEGDWQWERLQLPHQWRLTARRFDVVPEGQPNWDSTTLQLYRYGTAAEPRYQLSAQAVDVGAWSPFLLRTAWLPTSLHEILKGVNPVGVIDFLQVSLAELEKKTPWYSVQFSGQGLGMSQPSLGYRFENIDVRLDMDASTGAIEVTSPLIEYWPVHSPEKKLSLSDWHSEIHWLEHDTGWRVRMPWFMARIDDGVLMAGASADIDSEGDIKQLSALLEADKIPANAIGHRFPVGLKNTNLQDWLSEALLAGDVETFRFLYRGDLSNLADPRQVLRAQAQAKDLTLQFLPEWPAIEHLNGALTQRNLTMAFQMDQGTFSPQIRLTGKGVIPDVDADEALLLIDAHASGDLENAAPLLLKTPVSDSVGTALETLSPKGALDLNITINTGLKKESDFELRGLLRLQDALFQLSEDKELILEKVSGDIGFSDTAMRSQALTANWLAMPIEAVLDAVFEGSNPYFHLQALSSIESQQLNKWAKRTLPLVGKTPYNLDLWLPLTNDLEGGRLLLESDLLGLGIDLPFPFAKSEGSIRPLTLTVQLAEERQLGIDLLYGNNVAWRQRVQRTEEGLSFLGGHLNFGHQGRVRYPEHRAFLIDGHLASFEVVPWMEAFEQYFAADQIASSESLFPSPEVNLQIDQLDLWGVPLSNIGVGLQAISDRWNVALDAPDIKGVIDVPDQWDKQAYVTADFERLVIPEAIQDKLPKDALLTDNSDMVLPALSLSADYIQWKALALDSFVITLMPREKGYDYTLASRAKPLSFDLKGLWDFQAEHKPFEVEGSVRASDIGSLMRRLAHPTALQDAQGEVDLKLAWLGGLKPYWPTLSGFLDVQLKDGRVLGVEPGLGRILGLLSLSNIRRRLTLDFSDITKEGFPFHKVNTRIDFDKGYARTTDFELTGPIANIDFEGRVEIGQAQQINAQMEVTPNLSGSIPVAATIASGNPAVGALLWAFDKVVGDDFGDIVRYRYAITGSWLDPQIEELEVIRAR